MQFKVPQFIDIEDKVFGNLTFKQFAYLAGGAGLVYISFKLLPIFISIIVAPAVAALALALTFIKYNDKPFIHVVESFIRFHTRSRLYLWHKQDEKKPAIKEQAVISVSNRGTLSESKLKTLSWSLDVIDPKK